MFVGHLQITIIIIIIIIIFFIFFGNSRISYNGRLGAYKRVDRSSLISGRWDVGCGYEYKVYSIKYKEYKEGGRVYINGW